MEREWRGILNRFGQQVILYRGEKEIPLRALLQPVLGLVSAEGMACLRPSPAEVADTFTVPLDFFRSTPPQVYGYDLIPQVPEDFPYASVGITPAYPWARGRTEVPVWHWEGHVIWGMTARIVRSLAADAI